MKKFRSLFGLRLLHCLIIIAVFFSFWIIARPRSSKTVPIKGEKNTKER